MILFNSFPQRPDFAGGGSRADDTDMDIDLDGDEDIDSGGSKLTCPGEPLTSAQDYMR